MFNATENNQDTEPPQGSHTLIHTFTPVVLNKEDAAEFYQKLEEVRQLLPDNQKHFLKKDREIAELKGENTHLIGIKDEFGSLVAGVMVIMPVTRHVAQKYIDYPWDAMASSTALLSGLWTQDNYRGLGLAVANIRKVVEISKQAGMSNILSGVAEGNPVSKSFAKANFVLLRETSMRPAQKDQDEYKMNFYRNTFFVPDRRL